MTDHSDDIAYLQVLARVLQDLDPDGAWRENKLFKKREINRYSLTRREFKRLTDELEGHLEQLKQRESNSRYRQLSFLE